MAPRILTALPVYNEGPHVRAVLARVQEYAENVLVVDDGSTDSTPAVLASMEGLQVIRHPQNRGYGAALKTAFESALLQGYDVLVTIDSDGQHDPRLIPQISREVSDNVDIVSGSRYLRRHPGDSVPPAERRQVNLEITAQLNRCLGLELTDAFCGFKAYRVSSLAKLDITLTGYAMPLQVWVQAAALGLRVVEFPVPLVYLDLNRSFGAALDDAQVRLAHYRDVLQRELVRIGWQCREERPAPVLCDA